MSYSISVPGNGVGNRPTWQDQLLDHCTRTKQPPPVFNIVSDRRGTYPDFRPLPSPPPRYPSSTVFSSYRPRMANDPYLGIAGGRTAWSSTVTVQGQSIAARYWYDGQFINNAKEDAAEVALKTLNQQPRAATVYPGQLFPQATSSGYGRGGGY
ncbi:hypothetical protein N7457_003430 [Penicillium paradoxum]|uniref:uncharacterized protein n=1 Tax=Penicillium paradoxum TaxID=176176 RepID=UPI0025479BA4|nr:uncharacterized protein N7457_003430 [Penicillium paradoxum]KAJ5788440.1 hypothetical protein N7457_003430 [Penicillium paradoxum]